MIICECPHTELMIFESIDCIICDSSAPDLGNVSKLPAVIMCSSGTTGLPKGVSISHSMVIERLHPIWYVQNCQLNYKDHESFRKYTMSNIIVQKILIIHFRTSTEGEREILFAFSTLYWITGLGFLVYSALYNMTRVFTRKAPSAKLMIEILEKYHITTTLAPPYLLAILLNYKGLKPLKYMRTFACGGSVVSKGLSEAIKPYLPYGEIRNAYGCTEVRL
jgi:4-coumarate--CoA ligase